MNGYVVRCGACGYRVLRADEEDAKKVRVRHAAACPDAEEEDVTVEHDGEGG